MGTGAVTADGTDAVDVVVVGETGGNGVYGDSLSAVVTGGDFVVAAGYSTGGFHLVLGFDRGVFVGTGAVTADGTDAVDVVMVGETGGNGVYGDALSAVVTGGDFVIAAGYSTGGFHLVRGCDGGVFVGTGAVAADGTDAVFVIVSGKTGGNGVYGELLAAIVAGRDFVVAAGYSAGGFHFVLGCDGGVLVGTGAVTADGADTVDVIVVGELAGDDGLAGLDAADIAKRDDIVTAGCCAGGGNVVGGVRGHTVMRTVSDVEIVPAHRIGIVEVACFVFPEAGMVLEVGTALQEVLVIRLPGIPCGIHIIIRRAGVQLYDVPAVVDALGLACDQTAVDAELQRKAVQQQSIPLADGGAVDQCGVCRVLETVIVGVVVVVCNIVADVIVNAFDLVVPRIVIEVEIGKQFADGLVHGGFLCRCGVLRDGVGDGQVVDVLEDGTADGCVPAAELPHEVVTLGGDTGVLQCSITDRMAQCRKKFLICAVGVDGDRSGRFACLHLLAENFAGFLYAFSVFAGAVHRGRGRLRGKQVRFGDHIGVNRVDIGDVQTDGLRPGGKRCDR